MDVKNKRVLITGANGFIGSHLAERLMREGAEVRGLVRTVGARHSPNLDIGQTSSALQAKPVDTSFLANASPLQIVIGDVVDVDAVRRAVAGCDIVIHCAAMQGGHNRLADFRRVNVEGTMNLVRAACENDVARFVHLSTINVYGYPPQPGTHADSPLDFSGDFYSISKAEGERAAAEFARANDFPLVIVRPGCTYGPRSQAWTLGPLARVQRSARVLIGNGDGICNAVYIDNLVDLILLTLKNGVAIGQAFIGTEGRGVTWREFYSAYARMVGVSRLKAVPHLPALVIANAFALRARLNGYPPRISPTSVKFFSHHVVFDISKSKQLLGYEPRSSFVEGMKQTEEWLRANGKI